MNIYREFSRYRAFWVKIVFRLATVFLLFLAFRDEVEAVWFGFAKKCDSTWCNTIAEKANKDVVKVYSVGAIDAFEKCPPLVFDSISEAEFNAVKPFAGLQKKLTTPIKLLHYLSIFNPNKPEEFEYQGAYPNLGLCAFIRNYTADAMGFGQLYLLSVSRKAFYEVVSFGDGPVSVPVASTSGDFLMYFYNSDYQPRTSIGLLKLNRQATAEKLLVEWRSYHSNTWIVESIRPQSKFFYIKVFSAYDLEHKAPCYFKTSVQ